MTTETQPETTQATPKPEALWMLWDDRNGWWVPAIDDPGTLCFETEEDAERSRDYQREMFELDCRVVRVI